MDENKDQVYKDKSHGQFRELSYSYDQQGNFGQSVGFHDQADREVLQQAWDHFHDRIEEARNWVRAGKVSPIVFYMEKNLLDTLNLSMMAGISLWRVKWHFRPRVFNRLKPETLQKYATAFNITIDQLKNVD